MNKLRIAFLNDNEDLVFEPKLENPNISEHYFEIERFTSSDKLIEGLSKKNFSVIISIEVNFDVCRAKYYKLYDLPNYIKVKWMNIFDYAKKDPNQIASDILDFYSRLIAAEPPIYFSIITPLYHTRHSDFVRAYESLKNQTFKHWEWILVDDSSNKELTQFAKKYAKEDFRIRYFEIDHTGIIGNVKNLGFSLGRGTYLLELDHDDILMPKALERCAKAFEDPEVGFVYSDCLELEIDSRNNILGTRTYGHDKEGNAIEGPWDLSGTGTHYYYEYKNHKLLACKSPNINPQSVRSITMMPNHLRCWRKSVYQELGGHNPNIHVADDYELMVRTFLKTKMCRINSVEYIQHYLMDSNTNTQYSRNGEIGRITHYVTMAYEKEIHERLLELGADDYCWNEKDQKGYFWADFGDLGKKFELNSNLK